MEDVKQVVRLNSLTFGGHDLATQCEKSHNETLTHREVYTHILCTKTHTYAYIYIYIYIDMNIHMYVYRYEDTYVYIFRYEDTYVYIIIYI